MKKLILALLLFACVSTNAQVTLEHKYPAYETGISIYNLENIGNRYLTYDQMNNTVSLYDENHNLWKSIDPKIPAGYRLKYARFPSTMLFDTDPNVEVLIAYDTITGGPKPHIHIVDENGSILTVIPHGVDAIVQRFDTTWKLLVSLQDFNPVFLYVQVWSEVYSLPGHFLGIRSTTNDDPANFLYPNPMNNSATLDYTLPKGSNNGTVQIFSSNGSLIRAYPVSQNSGSLIIQRDGLPAGAYFITTNSNGVVSPAQKIIIN